MRTKQAVQRLQCRGGPGRRAVRCRAGILLREEPVVEHFNRLSSSGCTPLPGLAPVPYGRQGGYCSLRHGEGDNIAIRREPCIVQIFLQDIP